MEGSLVGKWYENAVFYHMYPIGMTGAPRRNEGGEDGSQISGSDEMAPSYKELGCYGNLYRAVI